MLVATEDLIQKLEIAKPYGFQISCRQGLLSSTKAIYIKAEKIYLFNMEDEFSFTKGAGYKKIEFMELYNAYLWVIEDTIS